MASIKENNLELNYGWPYGESGWNSGMDENIVKLGFESRKRINGILSSPPSSPSNGDAYIVGTAPTDLFSGKFANIAIYDRGSWVFITPKSQEVVFNTSDGCDYIYNNGWSLKLEAEVSPYIKIKDFTFSTGYTITDQKQCLLNITDNHYYQWNGTLPKVVPAGSTPATSGGVGVGAWSDKTDLILRNDLAASDGAKKVSIKLNKPTAVIRTVYDKLAEYISVNDYGVICDFDLTTKTGTDNTTALNTCLSECAGYKVLLTGKALVSDKIEIPDYTIFEGASMSCGLAMIASTTASTPIVEIDGYKSVVKNMSLWLSPSADLTLQTTQSKGVVFTVNSSHCRAENIDVYGKTLVDTMGFAFGFELSGSYNEMYDCNSDYCTLGILGSGTGHRVHRGSHSNHYYVDKGNTAWTSSSPYWDGVIFEGLVDSEVCNITCDDNGQSGIYCGGNNSLSYGNLFHGNKTRRNWNRGMDMGVSGVVDTATNAVMFNRYIGNESVDNREGQLWYYNNIGCISNGNRAYITSAYATRYIGHEGGKVGIVVTGDSVADNTINDEIVVDATSSACLTLAGTNNKININARGGYNRIFADGVNTVMNNEVDRYYSTWTPSIVTGAGVTIASSECKATIKGKLAKYDISVTLNASSPTGALVFGYLPGMSGRTIRDSKVSVDFISGFNSTLSTAQVKAYVDNSDQIQVICQNYTWYFDAAVYVLTGAVIKMTVEIEFA